MEDDIENISKLTTSNIYAQIDNELTKPIFVAQTMANDEFLKNWFLEERVYKDDQDFKQKMETYLFNYQQKYQYDAVYAISAESGIYYYFDGINKTVSPSNEHDDWYYEFLEEGQQYTLNIDTDEVNNNELTVFVDCRIEGLDGTLLGVTGVGLKMSRIQELLAQHETLYDLKAILINEQGIVQAGTNLKEIGRENIFDDNQLLNLRQKILDNRTSMEIHWYPEGQLDHCIITQYIKNMDWFLVIRKNTEAIRRSFELMIRQDLVVVVIILLLLLTVSTLMIRRFNGKIRTALDTDALTGLPNQREFARLYPALGKSSQYLFLFDIDHFKIINDTRGHMYGNQVLASVAQITREIIGGAGLVARWGGDEFIGTLGMPLDQVKRVFVELQKRLAEQGHAMEVEISISIGIVPVQAGDTLDSLMELADQELYSSKEKGGGCFSVYSI